MGIKTGYMTSIHDVGEAEDPAKSRKYGWKNPELHAQQLLRPGWRGEMDTLPRHHVEKHDGGDDGRGPARLRPLGRRHLARDQGQEGPAA